MNRSRNPHILTLNVGSSSIKFALFESGAVLRRKYAGSIERIGLPTPVLRIETAEPTESISEPLSARDHAAAISAIIDWIEKRGDMKALSGVGHRVVHGGPNYSAPQPITPELLDELRQIRSFDPQHLPQEISLIEVLAQRFPDLPQFACFDTAFFQDLPRVARLLPIPRRYEMKGVRRYGFHGLSYAYLMGELVRQGGAEAANSRVILAHLGSGASLAAVHHGKPLDTSMGFTPAAGVPMGTRSGDLDPGLAAYFSRTEKMSPEKFDNMVNFQSGLLGISEISSDMRELIDHEAQDVRAAEAIALFCYQVRKWIGAFSAALGGLDQLVFAGGVGENAPQVRARICAGLGFLGIDVDDARNSQNASLISSDADRVDVRVIRTDEEVMIANFVAQILDPSSARTSGA